MLHRITPYVKTVWLHRWDTGEVRVLLPENRQIAVPPFVGPVIAHRLKSQGCLRELTRR